MGRTKGNAEGSVYFRGAKAWISYPNPDPHALQPKVQGPTPFESACTECTTASTRKACPTCGPVWKQARAFLDTIIRDVRSGKAPERVNGPLTFGQWFERWTAKRATGAKERGMLKKHGAKLAAVPLTDLRPVHLIDFVEGMKAKAKAGAKGLSNRTMLHHWSNVHTALVAAQVAELIHAIPVMPRNVLPPKTDADPTWRTQAIFTVAEAEALMTDPRLTIERHTLYAIKFLTGVRHGEAVGVRWCDLDWTATPLPSITFAFQYDGQPTKTGATKVVPMHPALQAQIKAWRAYVVERDGREPADTDRVITDATGCGYDSYDDENAGLVADLAALGFRTKAGDKRNRGGHDFRRTFRTELRRAGVAKVVFDDMTHPSAVVRESEESYDAVDYADKCEAVLRLKVRTVHAVADSGYIPATATAGGGEVVGIAGVVSSTSVVEGKTVLTPSNEHKQASPSKSGHLRVIDRAEPSTTGSNVAATDHRLDALEAAARAMLEAVAALRR